MGGMDAQTGSTLPIPSAPGYGATSDGAIVRLASGSGATAGRTKTGTVGSDGYVRVMLYAGNVGRSATVHRLVAEAFLGPCPKGHEVDHINADKQDNRPGNLEYVTRSENLLRRSARGIGRGEDNAAAKITAADARHIRALHAGGLGYKRIAKATDISWNIIRGVCTGKTWAHENP